MIHNLHDFEPPFPLYLNFENGENPARKHFEKTTSTLAKNMLHVQQWPGESVQYGWICSYE